VIPEEANYFELEVSQQEQEIVNNEVSQARAGYLVNTDLRERQSFKLQYAQ
jgi:phosphoribosylformylglycinamidine (FGAM) synthase PurS component